MNASVLKVGELEIEGEEVGTIVGCEEGSEDGIWVGIIVVFME